MMASVARHWLLATSPFQRAKSFFLAVRIARIGGLITREESCSMFKAVAPAVRANPGINEMPRLCGKAGQAAVLA